jgi:2-C-methyl-D-erythritol 2,4-cyclodiphosphate synthase
MDKPQFRLGSAYDIHRLGAGNGLLLSGITIPCAYKALAHSDGDVVFHSAAESLLGAIAAGDLGTYFPPTDPKTAGMDSKSIVALALQKVHEKGYEVSNIDISVFLEEPHLAPYILSMRKSLAEVLGLSLEDVSIKAGTNEGLDAIGAKKAVGCLASVLIVRQD